MIAKASRFSNNARAHINDRDCHSVTVSLRLINNTWLRNSNRPYFILRIIFSLYIILIMMTIFVNFNTCPLDQEVISQ